MYNIIHTSAILPVAEQHTNAIHIPFPLYIYIKYEQYENGPTTTILCNNNRL